MMNDSVREELQTRIIPGRIQRASETTPSPTPAPMIAKESAPKPFAKPVPSFSSPMPARAQAAVAISAPAPDAVQQPAKRPITTELVAPRTSPTLVGFSSARAEIPEWRLQLQNAVQQRKAASVPAPSVNAATGSALSSVALKAPVTQPEIASSTLPALSDPRVAKAIRRIQESEKLFSQTPAKAPPRSAAAQPLKFEIARDRMPSKPTANPSVLPMPRPAAPAKQATELKRDTNKLPPIEQAAVPARIGQIEIIAEVEKNSTPLVAEVIDEHRISIRSEQSEEQFESLDAATEIEDLASFSARFGAGLFDLIIASFASFLVLSPIAFNRADWFSTSGILAFAGVCSILMFLYMTICLGFFGKTMGMRLFSLELVDAVENEYPTLHQAAVNSSVFLLSLIFAGAGFIPVLFNEERRAAHDLLSGTILVREF